MECLASSALHLRGSALLRLNNSSVFVTHYCGLARPGVLVHTLTACPRKVFIAILGFSFQPSTARPARHYSLRCRWLSPTPISPPRSHAPAPSRIHFSPTTSSSQRVKSNSFQAASRLWGGAAVQPHLGCMPCTLRPSWLPRICDFSCLSLYLLISFV